MTDDRRIYAPTGRIDGSNAAGAERELLAFLEREGPSIVIDLAGLEYLSSAGLRVLLVGAKAARSKGGKVVLVAPRPAVGEVLRISGFDRIMTLAVDRPQGVAALG